ncbi:hypothetical protein FA95DRAFT_1674875 [Auriscalpium vulgare]|uniref:Uncharacterized protein n=1 Tax=Auriscalpium vulgare TaxID=40419 RepID=A0ACB8S9N6_9AGAM|nr:hypothetical protein FA95DRAFT_1674875 [Auriscalpium vulgare]
MPSDRPLAYFQASPVRGQLEPYDSSTRAGWRYLQCTDTPNELKVLLPPRTATLYAALLAYEQQELAKGRGANWDRILEIRHLKDRMIRKCQRLAPSAPRGSAMYRIIHASPDFRLREMEKWLKDREGGRSTKEATRKESVDTMRTRSQSPAPSGYTHATRSTHTPRSSRHSQASTTTRNPPSQRVSNSRRRASVSPRSTIYTESLTSTGSQRHSPTTAPRNPYLSPVVEESTIPTPSSPHRPSTPPPLPNPYGDTPSAERYAAAVAAATGVENPEPRPDVTSPEPLPYLYRPPSVHMPPSMMQTLGIPPLPDLSQPASTMMEMPVPESAMIMPEPTVPPIEGPMSYGGSELSSAAPSPPSEAAEGVAPRHTLTRRRSSLRQTAGRSGKVVSWAMDRDWTDMTKFDHIVYAAEAAGEELDHARHKFQEEISGIKDLRTNISVALERLRIETEKLQIEETVLRQKEETMTASFDRLKEKERNYKHKVHAVLEETKRAVSMAHKSGPSVTSTQH